MSSSRATSSTCSARSPPSSTSASAGSARLPTITGCTNSTATWRASERAPGDAPKREQPPAAREALGHRVTQARKALGVLGEELAVGLRAPRQRQLQVRGERVLSCGLRQASAPSRARDAICTSQSRHASMPSPVRALTSMRSASGLTWSML